MILVDIFTTFPHRSNNSGLLFIGSKLSARLYVYANLFQLSTVLEIFDVLIFVHM